MCSIPLPLVLAMKGFVAGFYMGIIAACGGAGH